MTYPSTVDTDFDAIERDLSDLRYRHDELAGKHDALDRRVDQLEHDQAMCAEAVGAEIDALQETSIEIRAGLTDANAHLVRFAGHLDWMHHHVCVLAGLAPLELQEVDDTVRRLVTQVKRAHAARDSLLADHQRAQLHAQVERLGQLRRAHLEQIDESLACSHRLVDLPPGSPDHSEAAADYTHHRAQAARLAAELTRHQPSHDRARAELNADDHQRVEHGTAIMNGERAWPALHRRLRDRLSRAVAERALFPAWFTTTLGHAPPAGETSPWLNLATDLVAYRLINSITDPVDALGQDPPQGTVQQAWRCELERDLHRLDH